MALTPSKQLLDTIDRASHALVCVRRDWTVDGAASALALKRLIERRGKRADVVIDGFAPPSHLAWLPRLDAIQPAVRDLQKFVIALDITRTKIDEIYYDVEGDRLRIHVTPKDGRFSSTDLVGTPSDFKYDLIVTADTPDYRSLGAPFADFTDFFHARPTINFDHDPANERYGNLNLVDITAASTAEVVSLAFREAGDAPFDEETATLLLAGLIAKTRSFRSSTVTPRTLELAAELMAAGAKREEIVKSLYRTRSVAVLKLWGRALARLKHDAANRIAWTVLVRQDFIHAGAGEECLPEVIDELIMNTPEADVAGVLYERPTTEKPEICALIATERHLSAADLVKGLGTATGDRRCMRLCFPGLDMVTVERQVLASVRDAVAAPRLEKKGPFGRVAAAEAVGSALPEGLAGL
jgi:phosphoesterase RecJ-like protein